MQFERGLQLNPLQENPPSEVSPSEDPLQGDPLRKHFLRGCESRTRVVRSANETGDGESSAERTTTDLSSLRIGSQPSWGQLAAKQLCLWICALCCCGGWVSPAWGITEAERAKLAELSQRVSAAGEQFAAGDFSQSAASITSIQTELVELLKSKDAALQRLAKPIYLRVLRAHSLLELEGASLQPLASWEDLTADSPPLPAAQSGSAEQPVSFTRDIAPWLLRSCGSCHVAQQRGQFSMATYAALLQGVRGATVLFAGNSRGSRLVEVIESGDMPRGGGQVTPEQLSTLKKWIDQGAKFDGPSPTAALSSYAGDAAKPAEASQPQELKVSAPTGAETVSFSKTIAPVLKANCTGCHIGSQQASGGLRMDTFAQMLRGGDSGLAFQPGKGAESLLVKKLKGEAGDRMPAGGRPALQPAEIAAIETWVQEGAKFDGPSPAMNIETVIDQVWAVSAKHQELFERRRQLSLERWVKVIPRDQPARAENDEFLVLGNVPAERVERTLQQMKQASVQVKKWLKADEAQPLVKGGITVFVLKSRYDYSEFGRMTENRELPRDWPGHWYADPLDAYGALAAEALADRPKPTDKQAEALAVQIVAGAHMGSFHQVPTWFAEGIARNAIRQIIRRGDPRIEAWQQQYATALLKVENPQQLIEGRLDEETAGLVGMGLTNFLMDRSNRRRFDQLLELLRSGQSFEAAITTSFAPPEALVKSWLGKK